MAFFDKIKSAFVRNKDKDRYIDGLSRSRKSFGDRIRKLSNSFKGINDELLEEIMMILLESDMGVQTASEIVERFENNASELKNFDSMEDYLMSILYDYYNPDLDEPVNMNPNGPTVIMMVGVNGSGKTTTTAKLAAHYQSEGKKVVLAAADTFRAGAVDQIQIWADRLGVPCVAGKPNQDPASVVVLSLIHI